MAAQPAPDRRTVLRAAAGGIAALPALACRGGGGSNEPWNVLIVTADDLSREATGLHGCPLPALTPNLEALAAQGARVERFHVAVSSCQPSRSALMTGRWPHRNGATSFLPVRDDVPTLPELLKARGYHIGILSKVTHLTPAEKFPWDQSTPGRALGGGRSPQHYQRKTREFLDGAAAAGRPFFLLANSDDPHRPFPQAARFSIADVPVPAYLPDLPGVRRELAQFYTAVQRFDAMLAGVLSAAEPYAERTLVICMSDNGMPFPFAKAACYRYSTAVPFVVRWPGRVEPGTSLGGGFASGVDLMPTVLEALGVPLPAGMDGESLLPALEGRAPLRRRHVFTGFDATSGGAPYPMRAVHDERYGYVFNAWSNGRREFRNEESNSMSLLSMDAGDAPAKARARYWRHRVVEELIDYEADPGALENRAGDPALGGVRDSLRATLLEHLEDTGDPLAPPLAAFVAERRGR